MKTVRFLSAAGFALALAFTFSSCTWVIEDINEQSSSSETPDSYSSDDTGWIVPSSSSRTGPSSSSLSSSSRSEDVMGTSKTNAIPVTVGYSVAHTISSNGENWFSFQGIDDPVIFETKGDVVDTYMGVDDPKYIFYRCSDDNSGEGYNALCSVNTTLGTTYFIKIEPRNGTKGTYTFVVTAPTYNIRTNPISVTEGYSASHTINSDGQHWFRFQGTGNDVIFETEGSVVNTNMSLFVGNNTSAILTNNKRINFSTVLGTTYDIKITGNSGTYTFNVRKGTGDGSSRSNAIPVTVGYSASHTISSSGEHWFSFLGIGEPVTFKTTGDVVDTYINVYRETSSYGSDNNSGEGSNALIKLNTVLGTTYFIKIEPRSGTKGTYTFVVE